MRFARTSSGLYLYQKYIFPNHTNHLPLEYWCRIHYTSMRLLSFTETEVHWTTNENKIEQKMKWGTEYRGLSKVDLT